MNKKILVLSIPLLLGLVSCNISKPTTTTTEDKGTTTEKTTSTTEKTSNTSSSSSSSNNETSETRIDTDPGIETLTSIDDPEIEGEFSLTDADGNPVTSATNVYTISAAGTYTAKGNLDDGQILIEAGDDDTVELELNGVSIACSSDSPIKATNADKVKISAKNGTENLVADNRSVKTTDSATMGEGAIAADCDLNIQGKGVLVVNAGYNNGIHTKDDLDVKNLTLQVKAPNNALKGKDSVTIESGTLNLESTAGDGIKTDNSDVSSKGNQRGTVSILGGKTIINALYDGIDASYDVEISGEETYIGIQTGTYYKSSAKLSDGDGKGIKADNEIILSSGTLYINANDDGIHTNSDVLLETNSYGTGNITINNGTLYINSKDDAVHADGTLTFNDGYIDIEGAHEGLEGNIIDINGGQVIVYATDDGINASQTITVSGGLLDVTVADGDCDGIDSNGSYYQTGGVVITRGPSNSNANMGAIDVDEGGVISISGGTLIALGALGKTPTTSGNIKSARWGNSNGMGGKPGPGGNPGGGGNSSSVTLSKGSYSVNIDTTYTFDLIKSANGFNLYSDQLTIGNSYTVTRDSSTVFSWTQSSNSYTGN